MSVRCIVYTCGSVPTNKQITLHTFPKNRQTRKLWTEFVRQTRLWAGPTDSSRICSKHFKEQDYVNLMQYRMGLARHLLLKTDAVPTVILQNQSEDIQNNGPRRTAQTRETQHITEASDSESTRSTGSTESTETDMADVGQQKQITWTRKFYALPSPTMDHPPSFHDKRIHQMLGLGERIISLPKSANAKEFETALFEVFPYFKYFGDWELLRGVNHNRFKFEMIRKPAKGYTTQYLLNYALGAGPCYIRPTEQDIPVEVGDEKPPVLPEKPVQPFRKYSNEVWEEVKIENPHAKTGEIGKLVGIMWRRQVDEVRDSYYDEYNTKKAQYAEAMKNYNIKLDNYAYKMHVKYSTSTETPPMDPENADQPPPNKRLKASDPKTDGSSVSDVNDRDADAETTSSSSLPTSIRRIKVYTNRCVLCQREKKKEEVISTENPRCQRLRLQDLVYKYGGVLIQTGDICIECVVKIETIQQKITSFTAQCGKRYTYALNTHLWGPSLSEILIENSTSLTVAKEVANNRNSKYTHPGTSDGSLMNTSANYNVSLQHANNLNSITKELGNSDFSNSEHSMSDINVKLEPIDTDAQTDTGSNCSELRISSSYSMLGQAFDDNIQIKQENV